MAWICSQLGAREHYAIPRALCQAGRLHRLYTDFWAGCALRKAAAALRLRKLGPLAARFHPDLANAPVTAWNVRALVWEANARARASRNGPAGRYLSFVEVGRRFAEATRDALRRDNTLTKEAVFFAYDTAALEALEFLRERGVRCVVDQMDPGRVEVNVVREEEKRWAGWQDGATDVPEAWFRRREQEWALADRVVVNSEFSRQALLQQGVPGEKLVVIPLCFEEQSAKREAQGAKREALPASRLPPPASRLPPPASRLPPPASRFALAASRLPLRVLWLGQVILRKGIQYLMEAARQLAGENIRFDIVGPVGISRDAAASASANVTFHGRAGRDEASGWYERADLFVLPTLSDGFALTQLEAMAHGLPVIATPNCGSVVRDGVDGFLVPPRDAVALAKAIARAASDRAWLREASARARERAKDFSLAALRENLLVLSARR